jgi:hypothetical protein
MGLFAVPAPGQALSALIQAELLQSPLRLSVESALRRLLSDVCNISTRSESRSRIT